MIYISAINNIIKKIFSVKHSSFFSHSKNYLLAEIFNKGIVFITIPIFTRLLSPTEYGILALFSSIVAIFTVLMGLNFQSSIAVKYYDKNEDLPEFLGTNLIFLYFNNILIILVCLIFSSSLSLVFSVSSDIFIIAVVVSSFTFFMQAELSYLQASQQSKKYSSISVIRNVMITSISLIWITLLDKNRHYGNIYSQIITLGVIFIFVSYSLAKISKFCFRKKHLQYALLFSIPLIPHTLAGIALSQIDRLMINNFLGSYQVGLYSLAFNVGLLVPVFVAALNNAWLPIFFNALKNNCHEKIQNLAEKYTKIVIISVFVLIIFSKDIIIIMADKQYMESYKIVPLFALSGMATFLYTLFVNYAFYAKRTGIISIISVVACLFNVVLNYILIPLYGYAGAAWANLISHTLLFALNYFTARYLFNESIIKIRIILIDILKLISFISIYFMTEIDENYLNIIYKITLVILFTLLLFGRYLKTPRLIS